MTESLLGSETSKYDMTQDEGFLLDLIGDKDAEILDGDLDFTGEYVETDGVLARFRWHPTLSPINTAGDYTYYMEITQPALLEGVNNSIMTGGGARTSPLTWDDVNGPEPKNAIRFSPNSGGSDDEQFISLGSGIVGPSVRTGIAVSYTGLSDTMRMSVKTSKGFKGSTTFTHSANQPTNNFLYLGWTAAGGYGQVRYYRLGFLTSAESLLALEDTVDELITVISTEDVIRRNLFSRRRRGVA